MASTTTALIAFGLEATFLIDPAARQVNFRNAARLIRRGVSIFGGHD
jgi:hypothetical protein